MKLKEQKILLIQYNITTGKFEFQKRNTGILFIRLNTIIRHINFT